MNFLCKRILPAIFLILLAGIIVYSNTFQAPFVLDDQSSIVDNIVVKEPGNVFYAYKLGLQFVQNRFVAYLTFALNYQFGGLNVTGYHAVNLLIHLVTGLLVYALLRLTFRTPWFRDRGQELSSPSPGLTPSSRLLAPHCFIPLFGALLFVLHPVQTQAVTYIVQRLASLTTLFYLLSVVLYVKARLRMDDSGGDHQVAEGLLPDSEEKGSSRLRPRLSLIFYYGGSVLAAVLAMKTKEVAFTLPMAIVLYEIFFFRGAWKRRLLYLLPLLSTLPIIPLTIMGILDVGVDESSEYISIASPEEQLRTGTSMSRLDYLFTQFRVIVTYLRLMVLPVNQNLDYDYPVFTTFFTPSVFLSFFLLAVILAFALYLFLVSGRTSGASGKNGSIAPRLISFGILWFFLTLSVESSLIPIKDVIMEHRLYLPFFGAATAFAMSFYLLLERLAGPLRGRVLLLSAATLVLVLGAATYQRNQVWQDPVRLWQDVVSKSPNKARPINNLGKALEASGQRAEAVKAFTRAIKLEPDYYKAYYNLADLYLVSDQPGTALQLLQAALRLNPAFTEAYVSVGAALMRAGKFREVIVFLEQNLDRIAEKAEARFYLGASYAFLGNREAALRELAVLSKLDASYAANLKGMMGIKSKGSGPHGQQ
jgi:Flp pilus assembly protein TadD